MKNRTFKGVKKVCGQSKELKGFYYPHYLGLYFDISKNEVFAIDYYAYAGTQETIFSDNSIYGLGNIYEPMTMVDIWNIVRSWQLCHKDIF